MPANPGRRGDTIDARQRTPLHEALWEGSHDLALACLKHPFVRGLADGSLDPRVFNRYVAQDAFFLRVFLRAFALAAAACDDLEKIRDFHALMEGVLHELDLHAVCAAELSIDLERVEPYPETRAYTDFLLGTARSGDVGMILAAMAPCMRLYAYLGGELARRRSPSNPYDEWIAAYASEEFEALAGKIEAMLDDVGGHAEDIRQAYRYAMECELAFFGAPLRDVDGL